MRLQRRRHRCTGGGWAAPPLTEAGSAGTGSVASRSSGRSASLSPKRVPPDHRDVLRSAARASGIGGRFDYYDDDDLLSTASDDEESGDDLTAGGLGTAANGPVELSASRGGSSISKAVDTHSFDTVAPSPLRTPRRSLTKDFDGLATTTLVKSKWRRNDERAPRKESSAAPLVSIKELASSIPRKLRLLPGSSSAPCCPACRADPCAHCFYRIGMDRLGRHVIYSCAGRARNKVVMDNCLHMAFELERIFDHGAADGKVVWVIDFKGFGIRDCNPNMGANALPM